MPDSGDLLVRPYPLLPVVSCVAAVLALSACAPRNDDPFDVTIVNVGDVTTYLNAGESTGLLLAFEEQIDGEWTFLSTSLAGMCQPRCGAPPGAITCADMAAELLTALALLPGDSTSKTFDGEFWFSTPQGCVRRAPLTNPVRATLCHDDAVVDFEGQPIPEPTESGPVGGPGDGAMLEQPNCEVFPIDLDVEGGPPVAIDEG